MAVRVDASGEYIRRTANLPTNGAFTVAGWFNIVSDRTGQWRYFIALENATTNATDWALLGLRDNNEFGIDNRSGSGTFSSTPSVGTWFYAALYAIGNNTSDLKGIWWNTSGVAVTTQVGGSHGAFTPAVLYIGNDSYDEWNGIKFAHVKVWDAALTQTELEQEMWSVRPQRMANLNVWSPLFVHGDVNDYSGNGRNWTAGGTLSTEDGPPVSWGAKSWVLPYVAAAGGSASGTLSATLDAVTLSSAGKAPVVGVSAATLAAVTSAASGAAPVVGSASSTLVSLSVSSVGVVAVVGASSSTLAAATLAASGTAPVVGAASNTLGAVSVSSVGVSVASGALSVTLAAVTTTAAGQAPSVGVLAVTLGSVTAASAGVVPVVGAAAVTLDGLQVTATGVTGVTVIGSLSATLASASLAAAGVAQASGSAAVALGAVTLASSGASRATGTAFPALEDVQSVSNAVALVRGLSVASLASLTSVGLGGVLVVGSGGGVLGSLSLSGAIFVGEIAMPVVGGDIQSGSASGYALGVGSIGEIFGVAEEASIL